MKLKHFFFVLALLIFTSSLSFADSIKFSQKSISVGNNTIKLNILTIPDSSEYSFKVVSTSPVGSVSDLKTLVSSEKGIAGINGTFFEAYESDASKRYPDGLLIEDNKIVRGGKNPAFFYDGTKQFGTIDIKITGAINGSYNWPNNWYAWDINHVYTAKDQAVLFTSAFGKVPSDGNINVIVQNGKVSRITTTPSIAPTDGYIIHIGQNESTKDRFKIGDKVEYKITYLVDGSPLNSDIKYALGAGPKLLTNDKVDVNFERDGFSSEKIKTLRSSRSFVGLDKEGHTVIGTTPLASIKELAQALLSAGLTDAMNLDGGASSGMFYEGKYITTPGRQISNAFVIVKNAFPSISVSINGKTIEQKGIIKNNTTYVPLRGVLENLELQVLWNSTNHTVTCKNATKEIVLSISDDTNSDGFAIDSKSYVPLRLIGEKFGFDVIWSSQTNEVKISGAVVK